MKSKKIKKQEVTTTETKAIRVEINGEHGSGKSSVAKLLQATLRDLGIKSEINDEDEAAHNMCMNWQQRLDSFKRANSRIVIIDVRTR